MLKEILQGRFMNHPLHPVLTHLPVGLWLASLILDLVFMASGNPVVAGASYYCIIIGLAGALLAIPTGLAEYIEIPVNTIPKRLASAHYALNVVAFALYLIDFLMRNHVNGGLPNSVTGGQLALNVISAVTLGASGFLGGLLVYEHGVGFRPEERDSEDAGDERRVA